MRRRNRIHIEDFPIGGVTAMEIIAIPRAHSLGTVVDVLLGDIYPPGNRIRLPDPIYAAAFWHRLAWLDDAGAGSDTVTWVDLAGHLAIGAIGERETA